MALLNSCNLLNLGLLALTLSACDRTEITFCNGPRVISPKGDCEAYYYKTDYSAGGYTAQALIQCMFDATELGGNIVSYHNDIAPGIGFRWISEYELEVLLSPMAEDADKIIGTSKTATYLGRVIQYHFHELEDNHPEAVGCIPT